jgi:hypothetical protein
MEATVALAVLVALVGLLIWRPWEAKPAAKPAAATLALTGLSADVSPSAGGCGTKFVFTGKVGVRAGSGQLTYQWIKPDGATTDPTTGAVEPGRRVYDANLEYTLRGPGHLRGDAVLIVTKTGPAPVSSGPHRLCLLGGSRAQPVPDDRLALLR